MFQRKPKDSLPGWLWFFLALPIALIVALLYKRRRLPAVLQERLRQQIQQLERAARPAPRYVEPDSIPLNMADAPAPVIPPTPPAPPAPANPPSAGGPPAAVEPFLPDAPPPSFSANAPLRPEAGEPAPVIPLPVAQPSSVESPPNLLVSEPLARNVLDEDAILLEQEPAPVSVSEPDVPDLPEDLGQVPGAEESHAIDQDAPPIFENLQVIEGIGPSIEGLLRENGVRTYFELARTSVAQLVDILTTARINRLSDPSTWPEQAGLAAEDRWEELDALQRQLKAGRRRSG